MLVATIWCMHANVNVYYNALCNQTRTIYYS